MEMYRIPAGIYQANCYIVMEKETSKAIVIDPGGDFDNIKNLIENKNLKVDYILLTHAHADHIGAVYELKNYTKAKVLVHEEDYEMLRNSKINHSDLIGDKTIEIDADVKLKDNDEISIGKIKFKIIHTPGHSKGSICIKFGKVIFTGDTLFEGSIGRTDLEGGSFEEIIKSIKEKIITLPNDTVVYPGHGPSTTVENEKANNPFLQ